MLVMPSNLRRCSSESLPKYGNGRGLHRKQILGLPAKFEVLSGLPEYAQAGLFAQAGEYDVLVRLSNGGSDVRRDSVPDIRGFPLRCSA